MVRSFLLWVLLVTVGWSQDTQNPSLPGFDLEGSDERAIRIADEVMAACGGRDAWDNTHYVTWRHFGRRLHVWDKWSGNIRVEAKNTVILLNVHSRQGKAWKEGEKISHPDSLEQALQFGYEAWINDSYWLFLPFKLKDSGVTLKYLGERKTQDERDAETLSLTFKEVGVTPHNKYHVYVDKETHLVSQWDFFRDAADKEPRFSNPWLNYQKYGKILLSDDRGRGKHSDIMVFDELPVAVFESPEPVDLAKLLDNAAE